MDDRLLNAPCGYLTLDDNCRILSANHTLLALIGYQMDLLYMCKFESILSRASRVIFQIYFAPLIKLNQRIDEMYVSLTSVTGENVPVLLSAVRREHQGSYSNECVLLPMQRQMEYERQITQAEYGANRAKSELEQLQHLLKTKEDELRELTAKLEEVRSQAKAAEQSLAQIQSELKAAEGTLSPYPCFKKPLSE
ncbi:serine/threonine protein phosphatase [Paenibacillus sp. GD4]|jgi:phosphoserine phosphatase RsbU/P|uniref:serine/threonine protein phosphatase n=1 Tax=Paenibacillus sp. GD4 TaxID=3068890 RepID=UPI0027966369|nr:serine/threonine protein phosphatase [Paenibacillus sp. GD4]MDQ1910104.1 serine/threonine protein phosphatase [Paenibacillus sp. GD4]